MPDRPTTRLRGHALRSEGMPYVRDRDGQWTRLYVVYGGGTGYGLCECGTDSGELPSDGARKRWHREHKEEVRRGQGPADR